MAQPPRSRRLSILTAQEIDDLYGLPRFDEDDRLVYFDLSAAERDAVEGVHTTSAAVHLVLQLGYFKAKQRFFAYERAAVLDDLGSGALAALNMAPHNSFVLNWPSSPAVGRCGSG
jgi:hypothetical protein